jgi:hypothetical protein
MFTESPTNGKKTLARVGLQAPSYVLSSRNQAAPSTECLGERGWLH